MHVPQLLQTHLVTQKGTYFTLPIHILCVQAFWVVWAFYYTVSSKFTLMSHLWGATFFTLLVAHPSSNLVFCTAPTYMPFAPKQDQNKLLAQLLCASSPYFISVSQTDMFTVVTRVSVASSPSLHHRPRKPSSVYSTYPLHYIILLFPLY